MSRTVNRISLLFGLRFGPLWLLYPTAFGLSAGADNLLKPFPTEVLVGEILNIGSQSGFHFEMTAPQKCDAKEPLTKSARRVQCQFTAAGQKEILVSVCDDGKTACHPVHASVVVTAGAAASASRPAAPSASLESAQVEIKHELLKGFESLTLKDAIQAKDSRPMFVMISTDWCPPCNEAKENLLSKEGFLKATSDWRRLYVDGDSFESEAWKGVTPFWGYPSFILLNSDFKEVGRYGGENRLHDFEAWVADVKAWYPRPVQDVVASVMARRQGAWLQKIKDLIHGTDAEKEKNWALGWALQSKSKAIIAQFSLEDVPASLRLDWLHYQFEAHTDAAKGDRIKELTQLVEAERTSGGFGEDLDDLCEMDMRACQLFRKDLDNRKAWLDRQIFASDAEKRGAMVDEFYNQNSIYKKLGDQAKAKEAARNCVEAAEREGEGSALKLARAANIGRVHCLVEVGRNDDAEVLLKQLITAYPNEATFYLTYARFLWNKKNELKEAYTMVQKATANSYGYNWMKATWLKAHIELAMQDKDKALDTVHGALSELNLSSSDPEDRDQKWASRLRNFQQEVQSGQNPILED